jgi:hypothetical protein
VEADTGIASDDGMRESLGFDRGSSDERHAAPTSKRGGRVATRGSGMLFAFMLAGLAGPIIFTLDGCAPGPRSSHGGIGRGGPAEGEIPDALPRASLELMEATIVDLNPAEGRMAVKDNRTHRTWTVAVTDETRIMSDGAVISLWGLHLGDGGGSRSIATEDVPRRLRSTSHRERQSAKYLRRNRS